MTSNNITLATRLVADPEKIKGQGNFRMRVAHNRIGRNGETKSTLFADVFVFGKEKVADLQKGQRVDIKGTIEGTQWQNKEGENRYGWRIVGQKLRIHPYTPPKQKTDTEQKKTRTRKTAKKTTATKSATRKSTTPKKNTKKSSNDEWEVF